MRKKYDPAAAAAAQISYIFFGGTLHNVGSMDLLRVVLLQCGAVERVPMSFEENCNFMCT